MLSSGAGIQHHDHGIYRNRWEVMERCKFWSLVPLAVWVARWSSSSTNWGLVTPTGCGDIRPPGVRDRARVRTLRRARPRLVGPGDAGHEPGLQRARRRRLRAQSDAPADRLKAISKHFEILTRGTFNIMQGAVLLGVPRVVQVTSEAGRGQRLPIKFTEVRDETTPSVPDYVYALGKYIKEIIAEYHSRIDGLQPVCPAQRLVPESERDPGTSTSWGRACPHQARSRSTTWRAHPYWPSRPSRRQPAEQARGVPADQLHRVHPRRGARVAHQSGGRVRAAPTRGSWSCTSSMGSTSRGRRITASSGRSTTSARPSGCWAGSRPTPCAPSMRT